MALIDETTVRSEARRLSPTLDHVYLAAVLVLLALRPLLTPIRPHDFWWHIATGRTIVATGDIPQVDAFSFTRAGEPFYNQSWLAQLLMYGLHRLGGVELLLIVQALVIILAYGLLLRLCTLRTGRFRLSAGLLLLSLPLSFDNWTIRPQTYTFPLFVAFLTILTEGRLGRRSRLWLLPMLMVLWVNLHGSFVLGLVLIGITLVGELLAALRRRPLEASADARCSPLAALLSPLSAQLALWGALAALATMVNPRGPAVLGYVGSLLGSSAVSSLVTEWAPPTVHEASGAIFFAFVIVLAAVLIYARSRPPLTDMLLVGAFFWLALGAGRSIVWFGFVATPLLAAQAATLLPPARTMAPGAPVLNGLLIGLLGLLLFASLPWIKPSVFPPQVGALLSHETPVAAVEALRALPDRPRRLFHSMRYGSYLIWAAPEQKVFVDPRIELYPYELWVDYITLGQSRDAAALLERYRIDGLLLDAEEQRPLIAWARDRADWTLRYEDARTVLFIPAR